MNRKGTTLLLSFLLTFTAGATIYLVHSPAIDGLHGVTTNRKIVAVTFDDGPNPPYTERTLEILARHQARATFFVLGRNLQTHRRTAQILFQSGHEIANHGFSHQTLRELPVERQIEEVVGTEHALRELGYEGPIFFRPSYGANTWGLRYWLWRTGRQTVLWSVGGSVPDFYRRDPRTLASALAEAIRPGAILLLHDGEGPRPEMLQALDWTLSYLKSAGYQTVTVSQLLAAID